MCTTKNSFPLRHKNRPLYYEFAWDINTHMYLVVNKMFGAPCIFSDLEPTYLLYVIATVYPDVLTQD